MEDSTIVSDHLTPQHDGALCIGMEETPVTVKKVEGSVNIGSEVSVYHVHHHKHTQNVTYVINNCGGSFAPDKAQEVFVDQRLFLKRIQARFLTEVKPQESGLLERLRKADVIDSNDEHSAACYVTSRMQAAHLFNQLKRVPPRVFGERCMPILSSLCPDVLEGTTFAYYLGEHLCVRHFVMSRLAAERFADVLVSTETCSKEEYSQIVESSDPEETKWERIFQILNRVENGLDCAEKRNETSRKSGTNTMAELLSQALWNGGQTVPGNFHALVSRGLHCKCPHAHGSSVGEQGKRRKKKRRRCTSGTSTGKSSKSFSEDRNTTLTGEKHGFDNENMDTSALRNQKKEAASKCSSSSEYPMSEKEGQEDGESCLSSPESSASEDTASLEQMNQSAQNGVEIELNSRFERLKLVTILESLNMAIKTASQVKPAALELEGILDTINILTLTDPASSETTTGPENADVGKVARLRGKANELHSLLNALFERASQTFDSKAIQAELKSLPLSQKYVEGKWFVLVNELNEASDFVRKSQIVMEKLESCMPSRFQLMSS